MWWSRLFLALAVLALGPSACGFKPLYGRSDARTSPVAEELASVRIAGIEDRLGQQMRNKLVQGMNPLGEPASSRYLLEVTLSESLSGLAESSDGKATIGQMTIIARYVLKDGQTGKAVHSRETRSYGSYRYLGARYASVVSERDAEESVVTSLADDIRMELSTWFLERRVDKPQTFGRTQP